MRPLVVAVVMVDQFLGRSTQLDGFFLYPGLTESSKTSLTEHLQLNCLQYPGLTVSNTTSLTEHPQLDCFGKSGLTISSQTTLTNTSNSIVFTILD